MAAHGLGMILTKDVQQRTFNWWPPQQPSIGHVAPYREMQLHSGDVLDSKQINLNNGKIHQLSGDWLDGCLEPKFDECIF